MYLTAESLILVEKWECLHLNLHECGLPQADADCKTGGGRGVVCIIEMHASVLRLSCYMHVEKSFALLYGYVLLGDLLFLKCWMVCFLLVEL